MDTKTNEPLLVANADNIKSPSDHIYFPVLVDYIKKMGDEKKGCERFIKSLPEADKSRLENLYSEVTFTVRSYGRGKFYCWPNHELFFKEKNGIDPWPASRYPKFVIMAEMAVRT